MKYTVEVTVEVTGEIEIEADSFDEAKEKARLEAKFNRGEKLMLPSISVQTLFATNADGEEHEYDD